MIEATGNTALAEAQAFRQKVRRGEHARHTAGQAAGMVQGNVAILTADIAADFLRFCLRNPKPCPLIGMASPAIRACRSWATSTFAPTSPCTGCSSTASSWPSRPIFRTGGATISWPSCWAAPCRSTRRCSVPALPSPRRAGPRGADVPDLARDGAGRPVPRTDGGLDAAFPAQGRDPRDRDHLAAPADARRAGPLRRSGCDRDPRSRASGLWPGDHRWHQARCRCSGPAASRPRRSSRRRARRSASPTSRATCW